MRQWLVSKGYLKSDAQATKGQVTQLFKDNYNDAASKTTEYVTWSDARIRAWLRDHDINVAQGTNRDQLVQTMRDNYVSTQHGLNDLLSSVQEWLASGVHVAEDKVGAALELLKGAVGTGMGYGEEAGLKVHSTFVPKTFKSI